MRQSSCVYFQPVWNTVPYWRADIHGYTSRYLGQFGAGIGFYQLANGIGRREHWQRPITDPQKLAYEEKMKPHV